MQYYTQLPNKLPKDFDMEHHRPALHWLRHEYIECLTMILAIVEKQQTIIESALEELTANDEDIESYVKGKGYPQEILSILNDTTNGEPIVTGTNGPLTQSDFYYRNPRSIKATAVTILDRLEGQTMDDIRKELPINLQTAII